MNSLRRKGSLLDGLQTFGPSMNEGTRRAIEAVPFGFFYNHDLEVTLWTLRNYQGFIGGSLRTRLEERFGKKQ